MVEMVVVLALLVVLWGIAAPRYGNSMSRYRAEAAARRIAADLGMARAQAKRTSTSVVVYFSTSLNGYGMAGVQSLDHTSANYAVSIAAEPYDSSFVTIPFAKTQVTFDQYGAADQSGQIVVQSGTYQRTISLDATTGRAVVQ
jgi:Tfp pilus assembly protein FimT